MTNGGGKSSKAVVTRLEKLDLQGCTSLDAKTLETVIENSVDLKWLSLRGIRCVDGNVLRAIAVHADRLEHLDVSRCESVSLLDDMLTDEANSWPALKTLKVAGQPAETGLLGCLALVAPNLETLDISYSAEVDDDDVRDFVALPPDQYQDALTQVKASSRGLKPWALDATSVMLTPAQAGELGTAFPCEGLVPRRVTKLRHLNLSHCPNVTQKAAAYLAYAVPRLEILEMANVGEMASDGLVALFETTPFIRRIDLEGATQACDRILSALTPPTGKDSVQSAPGQALEALLIGNANHITNDGVIKLLRACPKLANVNLEVSIASRRCRLLEIISLSR